MPKKQGKKTTTSSSSQIDPQKLTGKENQISLKKRVKLKRNDEGKLN